MVEGNNPSVPRKKLPIDQDLHVVLFQYPETQERRPLGVKDGIKMA